MFFCHIDICSGHYRNFKISLCQISNLSFYLNEYRLRKIFFLSLYSFFFFCLFKSRTHKILAQVRDHRWSFYDNCLSIQEAQIKNQQTLTTCPWIPSVCNQTSRMLYQVSSMSKKLQFIIYHKVVSATFLLVCFVYLKESTCETRKMLPISLQRLFSLLR